MIVNLEKLNLMFKKTFHVIQQRGYQQFLVWAIVIIIFVSGGITSPIYRSPENFINIIRQLVTPGILVVGQTIIMLAGGIDLSNAALVKFVSLIGAGLINGVESRTIPVIVLCLAIGGFTGFINSILAIRFRIPAFIATLATATILRGFSLFYTTTVIGKVSPSVRFLYYGSLLGIPIPAIILVLLIAVFIFILHRTKLGKEIYATGGNEQVAKLAGIRVDRVRMITYIVGGILAAFGGLLILAKNGVGDPVVGDGLEMDSITGAILGGVSLMGGQGTLFGAFGGITALAMSSNLINILRFDMWYQRLIKGVLIVVAVAIYKQKK